MKNRQYSRFTVPEWVKWTVVVIFLLLVACFSYGVYLYSTIQQQKTAAFDQVKSKVLEETELAAVDSIERYHGEKAYYIVAGTTTENESKMVFYPFKENDKSLTVVNTSEIIEEDAIKAEWRSQCDNCELVEITPALIGKDKPVWELTYIDNSDRYVIDYWSIYDGTRIEMIGLKRMFN